MEVVVIEDELFWQNKIKKILERNNIEDNFLYFDRYNENLEDIIYNKNKKIYLIDIELKNSEYNGIIIASIIREHDWKSVIIFLSVFNEKENIISLMLNALTYIEKNSDLENELPKLLNSAKNILLDDDFIEIDINNQKVNLHTNDVLYITKEKNSKYCVINTTSGTIRIRSSLAELKNQTGFKQVKKYLLLNENNVKYELKNKVIFNNNVVINKNWLKIC